MKTKRNTHAALAAALLALALLASALLSGGCRRGDPPEGNTSGAAGSGTPEETPAEEQTVPETEREGWLLEDIPAYRGGYLGKKLYSCGMGLTEEDPVSTMQLVTGTTAAEFEDYKSLLLSCGFTCEFSNEIGKNRFASCSDGTSRVYFYYINHLEQTNVIRDRTGCSPADFCYELTPASAEDTVMYAYGFNGTGQLILIHNSDNTWFVNDGATKNIDEDKLYRFMREKSGLADNEKLVISLWYITHAHNDHFAGVAEMIRRYHDRITVERALWNFPDPGVISPGDSIHTAQKNMQAQLREYYPDILYLKNHTGMDLHVGDVELLFLVTQEDNLPKFVSGEYDDYNNTSAVALLRFAGQTVFLPGDSKMGTIDLGGFLMLAYSQKILQCDIMQVSHHGYNVIHGLYPYLYPTMKYALFENTYEEGVARGTGSGGEVYAKLGADRCLFSDKTYAIRVINGALTVTPE